MSEKQGKSLSQFLGHMEFGNCEYFHRLQAFWREVDEIMRIWLSIYILIEQRKLNKGAVDSKDKLEGQIDKMENENAELGRIEEKKQAELDSVKEKLSKLEAQQSELKNYEDKLDPMIFEREEQLLKNKSIRPVTPVRGQFDFRFNQPQFLVCGKQDRSTGELQEEKQEEYQSSTPIRRFNGG